MASKPLTLWGGFLGPNPGKVVMILLELKVPYESINVPISDVKKPDYLKHNPNGRLPTLEDPNTGVKIWESGAIIEYLVDKYDPDHKLSFPRNTPDYYLCKQWLHFQMSGQGPYYGQAWWFKILHSEKLPSAIDRYVNEIRRVSQVLDDHLATRQYLVGDKCTYADIAWVSWQEIITKVVIDVYDPAIEYPNVQAWLERLMERPGVKEVIEMRTTLKARENK